MPRRRAGELIVAACIGTVMQAGDIGDCRNL
jgi:hypothetical protein